MGGWLPVVLVFVAGALGGILNALTTDNGFIFPTFATISNGARIWRPGVLGNLIVGAIGAVVSWALYSPSAGLPIGDFNAALTWAGFASAVLVGVGGARWLSAEVDKSLLKGAAIVAATKKENLQLASKIGALAPAAVLEAAVASPQ
jgi:hypothetical protein